MSRAERGFGVAPLVVLHGGTFRRLTGNIRVYFLGRAWGGSKNQCIPEPARARCRQHFEPRDKGALHQAREDDPFGRYQAGGQKGGGGAAAPQPPRAVPAFAAHWRSGSNGQVSRSLWVVWVRAKGWAGPLQGKGGGGCASCSRGHKGGVQRPRVGLVTE